MFHTRILHHLLKPSKAFEGKEQQKGTIDRSSWYRGISASRTTILLTDDDRGRREVEQDHDHLPSQDLRRKEFGLEQ